MFLCFFLPSSSQCRDSPSFGQVAIQNIHYYNMNLVYGCKVFSFPYFFFSPTSPLLVNFLSFFCLISVSHQFPNPPMPRPTSLHRCCGTPVIGGKWQSHRGSTHQVLATVPHCSWAHPSSLALLPFHPWNSLSPSLVSFVDPVPLLSWLISLSWGSPSFSSLLRRCAWFVAHKKPADPCRDRHV